MARGYSRAVQERFGRSLGCAHLELLARMVGPAVVQAIPSSTLRHRGIEEAGSMLAGAGATWLADTCHVWRNGGPGPAKLAVGWRPGSTAYPAPSLSKSSRPGTAATQQHRGTAERRVRRDSSPRPAVR